MVLPKNSSNTPIMGKSVKKKSEDKYNQMNEKISQLSMEIKTLKNKLVKYTKISMEKEVEIANLKQIAEDVLNLEKWLSDEPIQLYFGLLESKVIHDSSGILLLSPSVSIAIKISDDFKLILDSSKVNEKDIIILPVNNCSDNSKADQGIHWSLLVYHKKENLFYHYDSLNDVNMSSAVLVAEKLCAYFSLNLPVNIVQLKGPIQKNGFDCGIHTILAVEIIVQNCVEVLSNKMLPDFTYQDCILKRANLSLALHNRYNITNKLLQFLMFKTSKPSISNIEVTDLKNQDSFNNAKLDNKCKELKDQKSTIFVFGDSHAKGCVKHLQNICNSVDASVTGNIYPGAPLSYINNAIYECRNQFKSNDVVVVIGGTNSIDSEPDNISNLIETNIENLKHTNLVTCTIPYRYDKPSENTRIFEFNRKIYKVVKRHPEVSFFPMNNLLTRDNYTQHGLHLNRSGKDLMCSLLSLHVCIKLQNSKNSLKECSGSLLYNKNPSKEKIDIASGYNSVELNDDHVLSSPNINSPFFGFPSPASTDSCEKNFKSRILQLTV